jgi:hypothetical protein
MRLGFPRLCVANAGRKILEFDPKPTHARTLTCCLEWQKAAALIDIGQWAPRKPPSARSGPRTHAASASGTRAPPPIG